MSKGSARRPRASFVSPEEEARRWELAFGKPRDPVCHRCGKQGPWRIIERIEDHQPFERVLKVCDECYREKVEKERGEATVRFIESKLSSGRCSCAYCMGLAGKVTGIEP